MQAIVSNGVLEKESHTKLYSLQTDKYMEHYACVSRSWVQELEAINIM